MKAKNFNLVIASVLAFVFLISFASAALTVSPSTVNFNNDNSETITVTSNESTIDFEDSFSIDGVTFDVTGDENLDSNNETVLTITSQEDISDFDFLEEFTGSFDITDASDSLTVDVEVLNNEFCSVGNPGDLDVSIDDINIVSGYGDDEEWLPLDEIGITVDVENNGDEDVDDIELEWGIYDESNDEWIIEIDDVENFDLKDGDDDTFTISFRIDDSDLDIDLEDLEDGDYTVYVRATGEVDDSSNEDTCESDSENVEIIVEDDFVVLKDLEIPEIVQCDSTLQITGELWNIGEDDQEDVSVDVVNSQLGINQYVRIGDIDALDSSDFDFTFEISEDVEPGTYYLYFAVVDEDNDVYENDFDDDLSQFEIALQVTGECISGDDVSVSAVLQSGGEAGKELVVKTTVINSGSKLATYTLNTAGYSQWANSAELSQSILSINAGESQEVLITLDVKPEVLGEQSFNIEVLSGSDLIATQPVSVEITKKSGLGITGFAINSDNWHIWGIGFLNVILVVLIIIIAIRISRKK